MFSRSSSNRNNREETASFLEKVDDSECMRSRRQHWSPRRFVVTIVLGVLIYSIVLTWTLTSWLASRNANQGLIYTPARSALHSEERVFDMNPQIEESSAWKYTGPPSDALDDAWRELLQHSVVRITEEEMHKLGREEEGVRFTDGSGYLGQLSVFHNLHCVQRIHRSLHLEYYYPNITNEDYQFLQIHNAHCLDMLRQATMCQGDASPITMKWGDTQPIPLANSASPHQCVNWETLNAWAEDRKVNVYEPGLVVHPTLGPAYTKPNGLGVVIDVDHK